MTAGLFRSEQLERSPFARRERSLFQPARQCAEHRVEADVDRGDDDRAAHSGAEVDWRRWWMKTTSAVPAIVTPPAMMTALKTANRTSGALTGSLG